jgi:hypothetical protein
MNNHKSVPAGAGRGETLALFSMCWSQRRVEAACEDVIAVELVRTGVAHAVAGLCLTALVDAEVRRAVGSPAMTIDIPQ